MNIFQANVLSQYQYKRILSQTKLLLVDIIIVIIITVITIIIIAIGYVRTSAGYIRNGRLYQYDREFRFKEFDFISFR